MTLPRTPSQTIGPFFAVQLPLEQERPADPVRVEGRVLDGAGNAVGDALVEAWDGATFVRAATDADGRWAVAVSASAPYLALSVFARGLLQRVVTCVYFDAAAADAALPELAQARRRTLVAVPAGGGYRFDVHLQGERETVFFAAL